MTWLRKHSRWVIELEPPKVWRLPFTNAAPDMVATCFVPGGLLGTIRGIWLSGPYSDLRRVRMVANALPVLDFPEWYDHDGERLWSGGELLEMSFRLDGLPRPPEIPDFSLPLMHEGSRFGPVCDPGPNGVLMVELTLSREFRPKDSPDLFVLTHGDREGA